MAAEEREHHHPDTEDPAPGVTVPTAGAAAGAIAGATVGAIAGPLGAAAGAVGGAVVGGIAAGVADQGRDSGTGAARELPETGGLEGGSHAPVGTHSLTGDSASVGMPLDETDSKTKP